MSFTLRWVGATEQELDRVAETRMRCYAHAGRDIDRYKEGIRADPRSTPGDFLLAEQDGIAVGTATALSLTLWMRGAAVPCQGVAYVGTIKTHRRGSTSKSAGAGIATRVMHETLRIARERGEVLSTLMPFRASFYERFGYGLVERRCDWTVPLSVLPAGLFEGVHFYQPADLPELRLCRQRMAERGQCDMERSAAFWDRLLQRLRGWLFCRGPSQRRWPRSRLGLLSACVRKWKGSAQGRRDWLRRHPDPAASAAFPGQPARPVCRRRPDAAGRPAA